MEKNSFLQLLEREFSNLTPTGKRIASYLLGNPEQLPFESADSIAQQSLHHWDFRRALFSIPWLPEH